MSKRGTAVAGLALMVFFALFVTNDAAAKKKNDCFTIKDGILTYSAGHYLEGHPIEKGFDIYGYNYQARLFNGFYCNTYLGGDGFPPYEGDEEAYLADNPTVESSWYWPYRDVVLMMKWNDAWLSRMDCDGDGALDRHFGYPSYIGSGAWLTNHMQGGTGKEHWVSFTKIVAAPSDAQLINDIWYTSNGIEIGPAIWGSFATVQVVESGQGAIYISPAGPGLGKWK
jgi:hypothetical protein